MYFVLRNSLFTVDSAQKRVQEQTRHSLGTAQPQKHDWINWHQQLRTASEKRKVETLVLETMWWRGSLGILKPQKP